MIKSFFRVILLIVLFGYIFISPKTRYMIGISFENISSFLLWTVKYEDREKWIIDNQVGYLIQKSLSHHIK